jgi:hypothetical protein
MSEVRFAIYDPATGKIKQISKVSEGVVGAVSEPLVVDESVTFNHYIDIEQTPPVAVAKTSVDFTADKTEIDADGVDEITITGLPVCVAQYAGEIIAIDDGELILTADVPGAYSVTFSGVKYLPTVFEFEAV